MEVSDFNLTTQVLVATALQGVVLLVFEIWGGRIRDKYLIDNCGILRKLLPGDVLLANKGFDIAESVGMMQASLNITASTKGMAKLSALQVKNPRTIENVHIHIECVIGSVRQKHSILQGTLPINFISKRKEDDCLGFLCTKQFM